MDDGLRCTPCSDSFQMKDKSIRQRKHRQRYRELKLNGILLNRELDNIIVNWVKNRELFLLAHVVESVDTTDLKSVGT